VAGIEEALEEFELPSCVASSGSHEKMRLTLGLTGLWDRFAGSIFSADEVRRGKPAPDLFLHAAAGMSTLPERCLVVEDSPFGIAAAQAAGMRALGFAAATPAARLADADAVFTAMAELPLATSRLFCERPSSHRGSRSRSANSHSDTAWPSQRRSRLLSRSRF
jgi:beta-phosphoglucomutase-like phosphatase (HAD superfamily)